MAAKCSKIFGFIELLFSIFTGYLSITALIELLIPPEHIHMCEGAWTWVFFFAFTPLTVSLIFSGLALLKNYRYKWFLQLLPCVVIAGIAAFIAVG
ncbi:MAG: hypothetical protein HZB23_13510 [Deltaproteobacteria bacterium]|nr:hypothetical protein [Deltaproteobacteria bacterium]